MVTILIECIPSHTSVRVTPNGSILGNFTELSEGMRSIYTALGNHIRIVFEEMSSWTPLTMYLWMKTTF